MTTSPASALIPTFTANQAQALVRLTGGVVNITQSPFKAVGNNVDNDTAAIQGAIDYVSGRGGGVVFVPEGIYRHSGISIPSNISLLGEGSKSSVLRYTGTTGNAITLENDAAINVSAVIIGDLKLDCATSTTGKAIVGPPDPLYVADIYIDRYEIEGYAGGAIYLPYGLQVYIGAGRGIGSGGVGIQLGDRTLGTPRLINTALVQQAYMSGFSTNFISDGSVHSYDAVTSENCDIAILTGCRLNVSGSWIQATTTLLQTRSGGWPVTFDNTYFLNGASVEVDDPATMCTLGTAGDLSAFARSQWKGDATFKYRFATSSARALQIGDGTPAYLYNQSGTIRAEAATRPLEVNRTTAGAGLTLLNFLQQGAARGGIAVSALNNLALLGAGGSECLEWDTNRNVAAGGGTLATTSTNGFFYVPTCAGTPTGVPSGKSGFVPIVADTTNHKLYFYSGGSWRDAGP